VIFLDYVIRSGKVYIRVNNGKTETCAEKMKGIFSETKARNILHSLPKTLKRYGFHIEAIPDIPPKTIENNTYKIPESVSQWIDKFGSIGQTLNEAEARSNILIAELNTCDDELIDIVHDAELENDMNMYKGYLLYVRLRKNRRRRRELKDELMIISDVLDEIKQPSKFQKERIQKAVDGLLHRKYKYRVTEIEEDEKSAK
jgi:hypothetical protein